MEFDLHAKDSRTTCGPHDARGDASVSALHVILYAHLSASIAARSFMSSHLARFDRLCVLHASLDLKASTSWEVYVQVRDATGFFGGGLYKKGTSAFLCLPSSRAFLFSPYTSHTLVVTTSVQICHNSLERDARSYNDSMGTKYESAQYYFTRFRNGWARIRCDTITH